MAIQVLLTTEPLEAALGDHARLDENGAVLVFEGIVRNHHGGRAVTHIDYQAYPAMAEEELRRLAEEIAAAFPITRLLLAHRIGLVRVGEASLFVAIGSHHRRAAIEALDRLVDELKRRVPIWKHEFGPDGDHWVEGVMPGGDLA